MRNTKKQTPKTAPVAPARRTRKVTKPEVIERPVAVETAPEPVAEVVAPEPVITAESPEASPFFKAVQSALDAAAPGASG